MRWSRPSSSSSWSSNKQHHQGGLGRPKISTLAAAFVMISTVCQRNTVLAVDRNKFRKCSDTGFCKTYRDLEAFPKFEVDVNSIKSDEKSGFLGGKLLGEGSKGAPQSPLDFALFFYQDGVSRLRIKESKPIRERWEPPGIVIEENLKSAPITVKEESSAYRIDFAGDRTLVLTLDPFSVDLLIGGVPAVGVNKGGQLHFEHYRQKKSKKGEDANDITVADENEDRHKGKKIVGYWEDGLAIYEDGTREEKLTAEEEATKRRALTEAQSGEEDAWEEYFGGHTDSRPHGPASVGLDVRFYDSQHLYGLPEHASSFRLKTTKGQGAVYEEPFRLYTLDVFEYELDEPMALYGTIPFVASHTPTLTTGIFFFNPSETFVDVQNLGSSYETHWLSECGVIDLFILPGPSPLALFQQFTHLVGKQALPPTFALGYHQCRWNYKDEKDVTQVHGKFEELDLPYDVLWLDIEHTDGKRYFTWDKRTFPQPIEMQEALASQGRRMVTIIDPHIKRDDNYHIHSEATAKGLYIKDKNGNDFDGFCWPGQSSYLDFTSPKVRQWWAERFALDKYEGSTMHLYTWNDMNEPSVFNGPEVSMQKDCKNLEGVEHREWHNLYGMYMQRATAEGLTQRDPEKLERPFVLSRAFYAGSQRYGAIWTGDNKAEWAHLAIASPMLLSISVAGLSFAGADVGGFFGDTDAELMTRWMQAGAFQPFFRGHAHHDTKRKEPWVYGEPTTSHIRQAIMARYTFLPFWYTVFWQAYNDGLPVMRPLWAHYPADKTTFDLDDQWLIGSDLLVKPVTTAGATDVSIYFPGNEPWYDVQTYDKIVGPASKKVSAPINKIPVYQRGGSIIPRKLRLRRSSKLMVQDPLTLVAAVDKKGKAEGLLYMDDEHTLKHEKGEYVLRKYTLEGGVLESERVGGALASGKVGNLIERIVVVGHGSKPASVIATTGATGAAAAGGKGGSSSGSTKSLDYEYDGKGKVLTIRKPEVLADADWTITIR